MTTLPQDAQDLNPETIQSLQELVSGLRDSINYHLEAAEKVGDEYVQGTLRGIAEERKQICEKIAGYVSLSDEKPAEEGTFTGSLRTIWTAVRAGLNSGDPTVVLIEAERAEDVIVNQFKKILPAIAGNPVNDQLNGCFKLVKSGHDRVLAMRNAYQAK